MTRVFSKVQTSLYPDTVIFLGDLFDGGREWSTRYSKSPEERWHKYKHDFWLKEHERFRRIYYDHWGDNGVAPRPGQPGRKLIMGLPGNHDLGFGKGVQIPVKKRFNAYFGDGNRMDLIANHTFVSLDTVSLSALDRERDQTREIWMPTHEFLEGAQDMKKRITTHEMRRRRGLTPTLPLPHRVYKPEERSKIKLPVLEDEVGDLPTIVLTHVPLFRDPGTPCGPLRERWPPTAPPKGQEPLEKDDRNAIAVRGGYQYQNVLSEEVSKHITERISNIQYAFSGDDHDYCEVLHRRYSSAGGGIREITVKSTSWAMGVRKPGIVLVSLWNPIDKKGNPIDSNPTIQTKLCLLPDQLGTFIQYALLFGLTAIILAARAILITYGYLGTNLGKNEIPLLPMTFATSSADNEKNEKRSFLQGESKEHSPNSSISSNTHYGRNTPNNARSYSPAGGYGLPASQSNFSATSMHNSRSTVRARGTSAADLHPYRPEIISTEKKPKRIVSKATLSWEEFKSSIFSVGWKAIAYYLWLMWRW